jgi:dTDP-4-dehydrorhamnose 3,5-epimerase
VTSRLSGGELIHRTETGTATRLPVKDAPTVTPAGQPLRPRIAGVVIDRRILQEDERGELVEIYDVDWGLHPAPLVYAYMVSIRPHQIKGWVVHERQDDRLFFLCGVTRVALFDNRYDSPTRGLLEVFVMSERNRGLVIIPAGVFHAVKNIGVEDALFLNLPTRPYNHADPDKFRLPVKNDLIPFSFEDE